MTGQEIVPANMQLEVTSQQQGGQDLSFIVKVVTDETFSRHEDFDLASFEQNTTSRWALSELPTFQINSQETYPIFRSRVAQQLGYSATQIRLWVLVLRQNKIIRPNTWIPESEPTLTMEVVKNNMSGTYFEMQLYLDINPQPALSQSVMIFISAHPSRD